MEFNDTNVMSTEDFAAMFAGEMNFADETPIVASKTDDDMSDFKQSTYNEEKGDFEDVDFDQFEINPLFDDSDIHLNDDGSITDLVNASAIPDYIEYNGNKLDRESVEKALNAFPAIQELNTNIQAHFSELDEWEQGLNQLHAIATSEISEYIEHYQSVVDNERIDPSTRIEALNEIKRYKAQRAAIEDGYKSQFNSMQERKAQAQRLKGKAVYTQLTQAGWKQDDFANVAEYMTSNNITIPYGAVDSNVLVAIKKAAMFDKKLKQDHEGLESSVQRAIAGKPSRVSNPVITPDNSRRKAKAEALFNEGKLSTQDMFSFLTD